MKSIAILESLATRHNPVHWGQHPIHSLGGSMQRRDVNRGLLLLACGGSTWAQTTARTLKLSTPEHLGYWTSRGGKVVSAAYQNLGIATEIAYLPAKRALEQANVGEFDGELGRVAAIEAYSPNLVRVPTAIGTYVLVPVTVKASRQALSTVEGLRASGLHIGTLLGMRTVMDQLPGIKVATAATPQSVLQMLAFDRIDVAILPQGALQVWHKSLPPEAQEALKNAVELEPLQSAPLYHYLHKRNADLVPAIDMELQKMTRSGAIKRIWAEPD